MTSKPRWSGAVTYLTHQGVLCGPRTGRCVAGCQGASDSVRGGGGGTTCRQTGRAVFPHPSVLLRRPRLTLTKVPEGLWCQSPRRCGARLWSRPSSSHTHQQQRQAAPADGTSYPLWMKPVRLALLASCATVRSIRMPPNPMQLSPALALNASRQTYRCGLPSLPVR